MFAARNPPTEIPDFQLKAFFVIDLRSTRDSSLAETFKVHSFQCSPSQEGTFIAKKEVLQTSNTMQSVELQEIQIAVMILSCPLHFVLR